MEDENCYICKLMSGKTTKGEVRYAKSKPGVWLCLNCHLVEREMPKGTETVKRILQQCGLCHGDSSGDADSTPEAWFCYDCHQYLCSVCQQGHDSKHVSLVDPTTFEVFSVSLDRA